MTGAELKEKIDQYIAAEAKKGNTISYQDIATQLGITRQALNGKFKSPDLKSNDVNKIFTELGIHTEASWLTLDTGGSYGSPPMADYKDKYIKAIEDNNSLQRKHIAALDKHIVLQDRLIQCEQEKNDLLRATSSIKAK